MQKKKKPTTKQPRSQMVQAYLRVQDEIAEVDDTRIVPRRLNVTSAATVVLSATKRMAVLVGPLKKVGIDKAEIKALEDLALASVHLKNQIAEPDTSPTLDSATKKVFEQRELLSSVSNWLRMRGVLDATLLPKVPSGRSRQALFQDTSSLVAVLTKNWTAVAKHTRFSRELLEEAEQDVIDLGILLGERVSPTEAVDEQRLELERAYSLMLERYGRLRAALQFVRYDEGDADVLAPSPYLVRKKADAKEPEPTEDETDVETGVASAIEVAPTLVPAPEVEDDAPDASSSEGPITVAVPPVTVTISENDAA